MQVHRSLASLPSFRNAVITIGTFDGVHLGHQKIIAALLEEARRVQGESVIITFHPHPRKVVHPDQSLQLINSLEERIELLQQKGLDHLVIVPFTKEYSEQSAETYIEKFLIAHFRPHTIIIGYDHHFGKNRTGNFRLLEEKAPTFGYHLQEVPKHILDEIGISSTKIRAALHHSQVETAGKLLGYDFFFEGRVVPGDKLGRQLGYPTANLEYTDADKIRLGEGVYAVYVTLGGTQYKGMMSIGKRPTLNDTVEKVEVNLFDFEGDLYGQILRVTVKKYLRGQEKYHSLEALTAQISQDKLDSLAVL
ncbi:bifunctional riboflavin kinase/FAD synthetase [Paraflavisolibacter sp. H34]|uniref:bifunctional riboflavin kinase/FAD synthetase n=1 Tax=Huijunlia imazamoxiresistens TaxID=3127457 RepID=UPI003015F3BB